MNHKPFEAGGMMLLPPAADTCQMCATMHEPEIPHNATSMYYQVRFKMEFGRDPTWHDAMAHCDEEIKKAWKEAMADQGVPLEPGVKP